MSKKFLHRSFAILSATVLSVGAMAMLSGCTTNNPEVTITYTFDGKDYEVDYVLSRKTAPQTVQHFIELADYDYFDGLCVHDYTATAMYTGGYTYNETDKTIVEKDYFTTVKDWDLTQSVFVKKDESTGMNTVYGEFLENGVKVTSGKYTHSAGALVMFYTNKGTEFNGRVTTKKSSDGELQDNCEYKYNSATSLFYTYTGSGDSTADKNYCVFGKASDYDNQMLGDDGLLTAIKAYIETLSDEADFTEVNSYNVNQYDYYQALRDEGIKASYKVPTKPIIVKSVEVTKY